MDEETAAAVLTKLEPRNASAILNEMEPTPSRPPDGHDQRRCQGGRRAAPKPQPGDKQIMIGKPVMIALSVLRARRLRQQDRRPRPRAALTPVGSGLRPNRAPMAEQAPAPTYAPGNSFWQDTSADLFRDPRAMRVGDVVTVKISIKDKASLDNTSERSRDSKQQSNFYDLELRHRTAACSRGKGDGTIDSNAQLEDIDQGRGRDHPVREHRAAGRGGGHRTCCRTATW